MYFGQLVILPFILGKKKKSFTDYLITVLGEAPSIVISLLVVEIAILGRLFELHSIIRKNTMALSFLVAAIFHFLSYENMHSIVFAWTNFIARFFMKGRGLVSFYQG